MKNKLGFSTKSLTLSQRETGGQGEKKQVVNLYISGTSVQSSLPRAEKIKGGGMWRFVFMNEDYLSTFSLFMQWPDYQGSITSVKEYGLLCLGWWEAQLLV